MHIFGIAQSFEWLDGDPHRLTVGRTAKEHPEGCTDQDEKRRCSDRERAPPVPTPRRQLTLRAVLDEVR